MNMELIRGEKITLRPITYQDTYLIVKWRNNPMVRNNFIFREKFTAEMHNKWMKSKVMTGEVVQYIILDKLDNAIGCVYYRDIDNINRSAEFGIFIGEDSYLGQGIGSEVTTIFIKYGIETLNLHRIQLRLIESNKIAYKCYEKVGFKKEGILRDYVMIDNNYINIIFMSILEEDYYKHKEIVLEEQQK